MVTFYLVFYYSTLSLRVEGVLYLNRYVLYANRIYRRWIDDLCTEVTKLHSLYVRQFPDRVGTAYDTRVGSHEAINVGPYLKDIGVEGCRKDCCGIVRAATTEVGGLATLLVFRYEARHQRYAWQGCECLLYEFVRLLSSKHMMSLLVLCLDEGA